MTTTPPQPAAQAVAMLDKLEALAKAATPGPWYLRTNRHTTTDGRAWGWLDTLPPGGSQASPPGVNVTWERGSKSADNAAYIAAANPAVMLKLVATVRAAKAYRDAVDTVGLSRSHKEWATLRAALDELEKQP